MSVDVDSQPRHSFIYLLSCLYFIHPPASNQHWNSCPCHFLFLLYFIYGSNYHFFLFHVLFFVRTSLPIFSLYISFSTSPLHFVDMPFTLFRTLVFTYHPYHLGLLTLEVCISTLSIFFFKGFFILLIIIFYKFQIQPQYAFNCAILDVVNGFSFNKRIHITGRIP